MPNRQVFPVLLLISFSGFRFLITNQVFSISLTQIYAKASEIGIKKILACQHAGNFLRFSITRMC